MPQETLKPPPDYDPDGGADINEQIESLFMDNLHLRDVISNLARAVEKLEAQLATPNHKADRRESRETVKEVKRLVRSFGESADQELADYLNDGWQIVSDHASAGRSITLLVRDVPAQRPTPVKPTPTKTIKERNGYRNIRTTYAAPVEAEKPAPKEAPASSSTRTVTGTVVPPSEWSFKDVMDAGFNATDLKQHGDRKVEDILREPIDRVLHRRETDPDYAARQRHRRNDQLLAYLEERRARGETSVFDSLYGKLSDELK